MDNKSIYVFWKEEKFPYFNGSKALRIIDDERNKAQLPNKTVEYFTMFIGSRGEELLRLCDEIKRAERVEQSNVRETAENALYYMLKSRGLIDTMGCFSSRLHIGERPGTERVGNFKRAVESKLEEYYND